MLDVPVFCSIVLTVIKRATQMGNVLCVSRKLLGSILFVLWLPLHAEWSADWASDLKVGSTTPGIDAKDQFGKDRTLANLMGDKGLVLLFSRSADW